MKRIVLILGLALLVAVAAGCGAPDDELTRPTRTTTAAPELPSDLPALPVGQGKVAPGDDVRATGGNLIVNGQQVRLAPLRADTVAVVPGGVYFLNGTELWFTDLSSARATGFGDVSSLVASEDGNWLGFIDRAHGPVDDHGTRLAIAIAYDARTGKVQRASYAGMGDPATDDLAARYAATPPTVLGFSEDEMTVRGVDGIERIDLTAEAARPS